MLTMESGFQVRYNLRRSHTASEIKLQRTSRRAKTSVPFKVNETPLNLSESLTVRPLSVTSSVDNLQGGPTRVRSRPSHSAGAVIDRSKMFLPSMPPGGGTREEFRVAKATLPKKGLIQLTALDQDHQNPRYYDRVRREQHDKARPKTKPVPISHKKLIENQKKYTKAAKSTPHERWSDSIPEQYTVEELQRNILQFVDYAGADKNPYLNFAGEDVQTRTSHGQPARQPEVDSTKTGMPGSSLPPIHISVEEESLDNKYPPLRT